MCPFLESLNKQYLENTLRDFQKLSPHEQVKNYKLKLFNFFPLLSIKGKNNVLRCKLFGFIPLFKIKCTM